MSVSVTLILTFSLREKELRATQWVRFCSNLQGEGWGEGQSVSAQKTYRHP